MDLSHELQKLAQLCDKGTLTAAEFAAAKARLLAGEPKTDPSLGRAANRAVSTWIVFSIIGLIVFLVVLGKVLDMQAEMGGGRQVHRFELQDLPPIPIPAKHR